MKNKVIKDACTVMSVKRQNEHKWHAQYPAYSSSAARAIYAGTVITPDDYVEN